MNVYLRKSIKKLFEGIRQFGKIAEYEEKKPNVLAFCYIGGKYQARKAIRSYLIENPNSY